MVNRTLAFKRAFFIRYSDLIFRLKVLTLKCVVILAKSVWAAIGKFRVKRALTGDCVYQWHKRCQMSNSRFQFVVFYLAVEGRSADAQTSRNFAHLASIMLDCHTNDVGLNVIEGAQVSVLGF